MAKPWEESWVVAKRSSGSLHVLAEGVGFIDDERRVTLASAAPDLYRALVKAVEAIEGQIQDWEGNPGAWRETDLKRLSAECITALNKAARGQ